MTDKFTTLEFKPDSFNPEEHYYERVLNATIHPMVGHFLRMGLPRLMSRYCHLNPKVDKAILHEVLTYKPRYLKWAGADLFNVTTAAGVRRMVVVEVNSSPSGQKSTPLLNEDQEQGGYATLIRQTFRPMVASRTTIRGRLAVIYDKNRMEASGYAAAMADEFNEPVLLAPFYASDDNPPVRFIDKVLQVRDLEGTWHPIRAAFRYVTQHPWTRIPLQSRTRILNPVLACISGGRNKMVAAMAYELFNAELTGSGLVINMPETLRDVSQREVPLLMRKFGNHAVVKVPYSNAGQGVYTITNENELNAFMETEAIYDKFIVQSLIGNYSWSSDGALGRFYHVGTVPDRHNNIFASDLRMMVCATGQGFRPLAIYGRRAQNPLQEIITDNTHSWDMLGTNLSIKTGVDKWKTDTGRLLLMDRKDFNRIGIGMDDLVNAFVQTVLAVVAIDKMAMAFVNKKGRFRPMLFQSVNDDQALMDEILL